MHDQSMIIPSSLSSRVEARKQIWYSGELKVSLNIANACIVDPLLPQDDFYPKDFFEKMHSGIFVMRKKHDVMSKLSINFIII